MSFDYVITKEEKKYFGNIHYIDSMKSPHFRYSFGKSLLRFHFMERQYNSFDFDPQFVENVEVDWVGPDARFQRIYKNTSWMQRRGHISKEPHFTIMLNFKDHSRFSTLIVPQKGDSNNSVKEEILDIFLKFIDRI